MEEVVEKNVGVMCADVPSRFACVAQKIKKLKENLRNMVRKQSGSPVRNLYPISLVVAEAPISLLSSLNSSNE